MRFTISVFSLALAGCAVDGQPTEGEPADDDLTDSIVDSIVDDVSDDVPEAPSAPGEVALCPPPATAPSPDWTHNFKTSTNSNRTVSSYGTSSCSNYVVQLDNGGSPGYEQGRIYFGVGGSAPTTAEACVGTSLTVRRWLPPTSTSGWVANTSTTHGEWTISGCKLPTGFGTSYWTSGIRYEASAMRSYCPSSGPYCVLQYGIAIKISVSEG